MLIERPRGTKDILPDAVGNWRYAEEKIREICKKYGFREIRTPLFEHTELFQRGIGDTTDVVEKEMYSFTDRGDAVLPSVRRIPLPLSGPICRTNCTPAAS